jgi:hypothetical protein
MQVAGVLYRVFIARNQVVVARHFHNRYLYRFHIYAYRQPPQVRQFPEHFLLAFPVAEYISPE